MYFEDVKKWHNLNSKKEKHDLCRSKQSVNRGKSHLTVGIIVYNIKDPTSQVIFDSDLRFNND